MPKNIQDESPWYDPVGKIGCISIALPSVAGLLLWSSPRVGTVVLGLALLAFALVRPWAAN